MSDRKPGFYMVKTTHRGWEIAEYRHLCNSTYLWNVTGDQDSLSDNSIIEVGERVLLPGEDGWSDGVSAMPCHDKSEARDALETATTYAKNGIRFFPVLVSSDEEFYQLVNQNVRRLLNAAKDDDG